MKVNKTIKLYIGGKLTRTESGRSFAILDKNSKHYAHVCHGSRKDFRNAVDLSISAAVNWSSQTAFLRSQILYRMVEMMESKKSEFCNVLTETTNLTKEKAEIEVKEAINHLVYYSGFCDKYQQILGAVNPVSGPFHNFTTAESVGVVTLVTDNTTKFSKLIEDISVIILSGNSVVTLIMPKLAAILAPLSEVLATSDLPSGVVNLISCYYEELSSFVSTHREVRSVSFQRSSIEEYAKFKSEGMDNMKRVVGNFDDKKDSLFKISQFLEYKTVWHPIGI